MNDSPPLGPLANWTDPAAYPSPDDPDPPDPGEWAWEFLRRNPEYQRLWAEFADLPETMTGPEGTTDNGKWTGTPPERFRFCRDGAAWTGDPPPRPGESRATYEARTGGVIMPFAEWLERRFHLSPPGDPRGPLPRWAVFRDWSEGEPPFDWHGMNEGYLAALDRPDGPDDTTCRLLAGTWQRYPAPRYRAILFDLTRPLDRQLVDAKAMLKKWYNAPNAPARRPAIRYEPALFPLYLQLLDARAAGVEFTELAAALYPEQPNPYPDFPATKRIRKNYQRAQDLRDGGYLDMLLTSRTVAA